MRKTLERIADKIEKEDLELLQKVIGTLVVLTKMLRVQRTTMARLRRFLGIGGSEKTEGLIADHGEEEDTPQGEPPNVKPPADSPVSPEKKKPRGHGRIGADQYKNAEHIAHGHHTLQAGGRCPGCPGKLYGLEPSSVLRVFGQPNLVAKCWDCERLRCGGCGHVYTAPAPQEAQGPKYDATAVSSIIHLRFGAGLPHHRLERLQAGQKTPVPASTQWQLIEEAAPVFRLVVNELKRLAAQAPVIHSDDTFVKILEFMGKSLAEKLKAGDFESPERTGLFTTAIVSKAKEATICLFYTGRKHAGENLANLLVQRASDLSMPVLMSDALSRNLPGTFKVEEANCLAHGRRNFVDEVENYPDETTHILKELRRVYKIDDECKSLSEFERFKRHRDESGPIMANLYDWMKEQANQKKIEPNSAMGKAMTYMTKRWKKFTLFTRKPGVPLDNNIAERILKRSITHRKNSLFYRTQYGADIGDIYMSAIHTAEVNGQNPWDYLTVIQRHATAVRREPALWMPWNYKATAAQMSASSAP